MDGIWQFLEQVNPFGGLPIPIQVLFFLALTFTLIQLLLMFTLAMLGIREERRPQPDVLESHFLWVFMVPALNEEVTIGDTVARLEQVRVTNKVFMVINDGSTDRTGEILAAHPSSALQVLTRVPPEARKGKAAALNNAWRDVRAALAGSHLREFGEERTLVVIVDADGRLDPGFAEGVARHFGDPRGGGVQMAVRIYNRQHPLTYMQDLEFRVFGSTYQLGRAYWGTAGMGGNGQINRLSALTQIGDANIEAGDADGPWRHRLTEDQDLGLSLFATGWLCKQEMGHAVDQQGLSSFRRLFRQRVRWCQGNMQAMARMNVFPPAQVARIAKVDGVYWLLQPVIQSLIGISTITAVILAVFFTSSVVPDINMWIFIALMFLAFGGTAIGVLRAGSTRGLTGFAKAILLILPYALYCWSLVPIYAVAGYRQLRRRDNWAKTAREAIS